MTVPWATAADGPTADALAAALAHAEQGDILIVGCGKMFFPPPEAERIAAKAAGVALEWMDTGAACRTFNVLLGEERRVVAALIAVD